MGRDYWWFATSIAAVLFVCQVVALVALSALFTSDAIAASPVAFMITAVLSSLSAVALRWTKVGIERGVALAATATAGLWVLSAGVASVIAYTVGTE